MSIERGGVSIPIGADLKPFEQGLKKAESLASGFGEKLKKTASGAVWDGSSFAAGLKMSSKEFDNFIGKVNKAKEEYQDLIQLSDGLKQSNAWSQIGEKAQASVESALSAAKIQADAYDKTLKHMSRGQMLRNVFGGLKKGFIIIGQGLAHVLSGVGRVFSNIAKWGKRLGLAAIAAGLVMLKQGMENLYKADTKTKKSIDDFNRAVSTLKNALASAFAPILNIVLPILTKFINHLTKAANAVAHFFAALTGQDSVVVAVADGVSDIGDNAASANDSAKELQRTLMGFDKINKLDGNSDSSGSSSGSSAGAGFETVPVSGVISDWADKFKEAWEKADFTDLGGILGTKLKNALDSIPWTEIQSYGERLGKSVATGLNGFLETEDLGTSIGTSIAEALNTLVITVDTFAVEFHWDSLGQFIADEINGFFDNFDFKLVGKTLSDWANGLLTASLTAIQGVNWENVGKSIVDFIAGIDWVSLFVNSVLLVNAITTGLHDALLGAAKALANNLGDFGKKVLDSISTYFGSHKPVVEASVNLGGTVKKGLDKVLVIWDKLKKSSKKTITLNAKKKGNLADTALKTFASAWKKLQELKTTKKITLTAKGISTTIANAIERIKNSWDSLYGGTKTFTISFIDNMKSAFGRFWDWLSNTKVGRAARRTFGFAQGGVYKNGKWSPIQNFASGGMPNGSQLFWARENGPELVGTLGGHTAVMNNDQIVASVSSGVAKAISGIRFKMNATPQLANASASQQSCLAPAPDPNREVAELLNQLIAVVQALDLEVNLDGESIKNNTVRRINNHTRATGQIELIV